MKRLIALLMVLAMLLSLVACRGKNDTSNSDTSNNTHKNETTNTSTTEADITVTETYSPTIETTRDDESTGTPEETGGPAKIETNTSTNENTSHPEALKPIESAPIKETEKPSETTKPTETTKPNLEGTACSHSNVICVPNDEVPTCTKSGHYLKWCPECFKTFEEPATALGHTGGEANCNSKARCTRCFEYYGELNTNKHLIITDHRRNAVDATCEEEGYEGDLSYCAWCGVTFKQGKTIPAKGHDITIKYIEETDTIEKECWFSWRCGYKTQSTPEPISITLKELRCPSYITYANGVLFDVTGGYGGSYTCEYYNYNPFSNSSEHKTSKHSAIYNSSNEILLFPYFIYCNDEITITISDPYGHSGTKKYRCVEDPTDSSKLTLVEIS